MTIKRTKTELLARISSSESLDIIRLMRLVAVATYAVVYAISSRDNMVGPGLVDEREAHESELQTCYDQRLEHHHGCPEACCQRKF